MLNSPTLSSPPFCACTEPGAPTAVGGAAPGGVGLATLPTAAESGGAREETEGRGLVLVLLCGCGVCGFLV